MSKAALTVDDRDDSLHYNYVHFRTKHFVTDLVKSVRGEGIAPGAEAPDFNLPSTTGERIRLRDLRGRPVVLHFGSPT